MDEVSARFAEALAQGDLDAVMTIPKADRHSHQGVNGNPRFFFKRTGVWIAPMKQPLQSIQEMHRWVDRHIGQRFGDTEGEKLLLEAGFEQASRDGMAAIWTGEDVRACEARFGGDIDALLRAVDEAKRRHAPEMTLHLQAGLSRHCAPDALRRWAEPFFAQPRFECVDLYGPEAAQPVEAFAPLYRQAKARGMLLRAHVGERGDPDGVVRAVEALALDEVQHGVAAAESPSVMRFLADHRIRLNLCPTGDVMLGRVPSLAAHPIRKLFDAGVPVTLCADKPLMFGSSLSQEFLKLYQCALFTAEELNQIRLTALS